MRQTHILMGEGAARKCGWVGALGGRRGKKNRKTLITSKLSNRYVEV